MEGEGEERPGTRTNIIEGEEITMESADVLRGVNYNARRHWDGESWLLEEAGTRKPVLVGTREQILEKYDELNPKPQE